MVHLRRKQDGETVERFRADRVHEFMHLRRKAARWADDNAISLGNADPALPGELNDRAQDNARAICAIADLAGGGWSGLVRSALVGAAGKVDDEPQSAGVLLLRDIAEIFEGRGTSWIGSTQLCDALCALEESPWADWRRGASITTRGIAKLLKPFDVTPQRDREQRFYRRDDFADAFNRYLSDTQKISVSSDPSVTPSASVTKLPSKNNGVTLRDTSDTYSNRDGEKRHDDGFGDASPLKSWGEL